MVLRITDKSIERDLKTDVITIEQFNDIAFHPYLQSVQWDAIIIDIDKRLMRSYISQIFKRNYRIIPVMDMETITTKEVLILIEILPEYGAELMKSYREGKLSDTIKSISDLYKWEKFIHNEL